MKFALVILAGLIAQSSFAATLNLSSGETAVIEANTRTTVSCNGSGNADCEKVAQAFGKTLEYCNRTNNAGYCAQTHWPKFKAANPNCAYAGQAACLDYCSRSYNAGYCADLCE